jgi:glycosyltransferase involved in cell wall biosynthesis
VNLVLVNLAYRGDVEQPEELLDRFRPLVRWAEAVATVLGESGGPGGRVCVVQRFRRDATIERGVVDYRFVADGRGGDLGWWQRSTPALEVVAELCREAAAAGRRAVVHLNGLGFGTMASRLKRRLPPAVPLVVQHHAELPATGVAGFVQRRGLRAADGFLFAASALADPWRERGWIRAETPVFDVMEGSTDFRPMDRDEARRRTGLSGAPLLLWVGRLDANKDPLTVLTAFEGLLPELPGARLAMAHGPDSPLLGAVEARISGSVALARTVRLLGTLPHADLEAVYGSADLFVLGSHREGSGFALAEALACGVKPVVTDIPSFRVMTGGGAVGALWPPGHPDALADALRAAAGGAPARSASRALFDERLSWPAIGRAAVAAYVDAISAAGARARPGAGSAIPG